MKGLPARLLPRTCRQPPARVSSPANLESFGPLSLEGEQQKNKEPKPAMGPGSLFSPFLLLANLNSY